jgi:hypothetical protein
MHGIDSLRLYIMDCDQVWEHVALVVLPAMGTLPKLRPISVRFSITRNHELPVITPLRAILFPKTFKPGHRPGFFFSGKDLQMAVTRCTHLKINGARCTMPAVYNKDLCFHHESRLLRLRSRPTLPSTFATVPLVSFVYPEDHDCILENVHAIPRSLAHSEINDRTASVMDRLMNTALRTLRQGRKLEKTVMSDEMVRHFCLDPDGNPRATDPPAAPVPESVPEKAEPITIPAISAEAEEPAEPQSDPEPGRQSAELQRVTSSQNLTRLLFTLAQEGKINTLLSNTYILRNGKLIVAPDSSQPSGHTDERRATAYIFLSNMR